MKRVAAFVCILVLVLSLIPAMAAGVKEVRLSQVRQQGNEATLYVDLSDASGVPYSGAVDPSMFKFSVDDTSMEVTSAQPYDAEAQGIHYVFCVDTSKTITDAMMENVRQALNNTVDGMSAKDSITLLTFGTEVTVRVSNSRKASVIKEAIAALDPNEGWTALYKGVLDGVQAASAGSGRSVVIFFTDGKNDLPNDSPLTEYTAESISSAVYEAQVPIYCIGLNENKGVDTASLATFAEQTGGLQYVINSKDTATCIDSIRSILSSTIVLKATLTNEAGRSDFGTISEFCVGFNSDGRFIISNKLQQVVDWSGVPAPVITPTPSPVPGISLELDKAQVPRPEGRGKATITGKVSVDQGNVGKDQLVINVNDEQWQLDKINPNGNSYIFSASGTIDSDVTELSVQAEIKGLGITSGIARMAVVTPAEVTATPAPKLSVELDDSNIAITAQDGDTLTVTGVVEVEGSVRDGDVDIYVNDVRCDDATINKINDSQFEFEVRAVAEDVDSGSLRVYAMLNSNSQIKSRTQALILATPEPPELSLNLNDSTIRRPEGKKVEVSGYVEVPSGTVTAGQLELVVNSMTWDASFEQTDDMIFAFTATNDVDTDVTRLDVRVKLASDASVRSETQTIELETIPNEATLPPTAEPTAAPASAEEPAAEEQNVIAAKVSQLREEGTLIYWIIGAACVLVLIVVLIIVFVKMHKKNALKDEEINPESFTSEKDKDAPGTVYEEHPNDVNSAPTDCDDGGTFGGTFGGGTGDADLMSGESGGTVMMENDSSDDGYSSGTVMMEAEPAVAVELSERFVDRRRGIDDQRRARVLELADGDVRTFGRSGSMDQVIDDDTVSGKHMAISCEGDQVLVTDLGSSNGTKLNGTKIAANQPMPLHDGDELMLGRTVMNVSIRQL